MCVQKINVKRYQRGMILIHSLIFLTVVCFWIKREVYISKEYYETVSYMEKIEKRLNIEKIVFNYFRINPESTAYTDYGNHLTAEKIDDKIYINTNGDIPYRLEYGIMKDESFKLYITEE